MIEKIKIKKSTRATGAGGIVKEKGAAVKSSGAKMAFWITFLAAFIVLSLALIPAVGAFMEFRPLGAIAGEDDEEGEETELVILEEDFTDYFIPSNSPFYAAFKDKKRVNCLLLGVNQGLSDVIMLVSFDIDARHLDIISIPRDTYYHRPGYNEAAENKINAAYRKDPLNSARAVSEILLGMPINYYAVIEYDGVKEIVDAIGGVPVDIPQNLDYEDPRDKPPLSIHLKQGLQTLNGENAVKFLRFRKGYADADLGRIRAQQAFMQSAFRQALKSDMSKLAATVRENVTSDMPMSKMIYLARKALGMSEERISTYTMPYGKVDAYVHPDVEKIEEIIREIYSVPLESTVPESEDGENADADGEPAEENAAE
ncbi:MAG: LCP family protein [Clostridiales Family XIII bacterium]|jgi:LCP family protein required for cell wall assembly|nr:LCP family protein [Clostridiales Family XIII bacterium]